MSAGAKAACPSSGCRTGAVLLGIVLPNGRIAYAANRIVVNDEFVRVAHEGRPPEQRFRFSSPCMGGSCRQWSEEQCGLIDRLIVEYEGQLGLPAASDILPDCPVRAECRWYRQRHGAACAVCNVLVTDAGLVEADLPQEVLARRMRHSGQPT